MRRAALHLDDSFIFQRIPQLNFLIMMRGMFNLSGVTVEKTRFEVLKVISEDGYIHWENYVQYLGWFLGLPLILRRVA
jgi:bacteriorhodopsin